MSTRTPLYRQNNRLDALFNGLGLAVSITYLFIIIAIVATLVMGSYQSISRFSFSFLLGSQWNVRSAVALSPVLLMEENSIRFRFSAPLEEQRFDTNIQLYYFQDSNTKQRLSFENIQHKERFATATLPTLENGVYEATITQNIKNTTGFPLLHSYTYSFSVNDGVIENAVFNKHEKENAITDTNIYGALPFLFGTVITSVLAMVFSVPFAIAIAIYLNEYEKRTKKAYILSSMSDLLAGIPSVIYGFWGMFFLAPYFGSNILTASLVLAIMSLPYSTAMTREAIALVPNALRYAGFAMGATKYSVLFYIVIPYAKSGIVAGIILALGRALGETLAVTMVIGNSNRMPFSIFEPAQTIASLIANEYAESSGLKQSALIELGLLLICVTMFFGLLGRFLIRNKRGK